MAPHIERDLPAEDYLLSRGWTEEEIRNYLPQIKALDDASLLNLHRLCKISMFKAGEPVDREQAIRVLINPKDTPKEMLISSLLMISNSTI